jgi:hypothetical protein
MLIKGGRHATTRQSILFEEATDLAIAIHKVNLQNPMTLLAISSEECMSKELL